MEAGAEVVIMGCTRKALEVAAEYTEKGFPCHGVAADLRNRESLANGFQETLEKLDGTLDIFVNATGIQKRHFCEDFPMEDWDAVIDVNLNAVFMLCQLAGREMMKQGYGKIINVASMFSFFGGYTMPAYAASKGAVAQLTKALSNEWASKGIHVNAIAPGYMATEMNTALIHDEGRNKEILGRIPTKHWGTAEDMKGITIFLASQASDYLSGAIIPVDGGYLSK